NAATNINRIDKQTYKANQFESAKGGSAVDVLKNMPSVTVNTEGEIRLRGSSGFLVLVNGKPVQADPATILNQIPANSIENIELITAPSAKYDADGKSGIINITTKQGSTDGLSLVLNAQGGLPSVDTYDNKETPKRYGFDGLLNYQKNKWDVSFGANFQQSDLAGRRVGDVNTTVQNRYTVFPSIGERSFDRTNYSARTTATYKIDKSNSLTAGFYAGRRTQFRLADITYNNIKTDASTGDVIGKINYYNSNLVKRQGDIALGNLDFTHTFANKSAFSVSGLYEYAKFSGYTKNRNLNINDYTDTLQYILNTGTSPLHGLRLKADYVINIGKGKLESGYQFRYQNQTGSFLAEESNGAGNMVVIPEFSDDIDVDNTINAVYSQYSGKAGKLEYVAGLRYEYATRVFKAAKIAEPYNLNLSNFFPSANLLYSLGSDYKLKAGFSRRVQRSTNNELNPYAEREHSETLEQGDPRILPEFVSLSELGLIKQFKSGSFFATLYNQRITNVVNRVNSIYADTVLNRIYTNAGKATLWGIESGLNVKPAKWWTAYFGGNVYDYRIKGSLFNNAVAVNNSGVAYSINTNQTFQASRTWSIQFNLNYLSARPTAQGEDSRFISPNSSVKKSFMGGKLTASLLWQNMSLGLVNSNEQRISTWGSNFYTTTNYVHEKDVFVINLSYSLNQLAKKVKLPASEFGEREF
ncbi:MAG: TonB-dependent receptor domain-containing protein, partial [Sphingobacteriaceae bacterium]